MLMTRDSCKVASLEDDTFNARGAGALGQQPADAACRVLVGGAAGAQVGLVSRRRRQRAAGDVVDDLGGDVLVGAEHGETRPLGRAPDVLPHAGVTLDACVSLVLGAVHHLPALPALRLTCSPR